MAFYLTIFATFVFASVLEQIESKWQRQKHELKITSVIKRVFYYITDNFYLLFFIALLWVLLCFRSFSVGGDLVNYKAFYDYLFTDTMVSNYEPLYTGLNYLLKLCGFSFRAVIIVQTTFCLAVLFIFVKTFAKNKMVSLTIMFAYGYFSFYASGLRQAIALAFVMLAIISMFRRNYFWSVALIIVGALFHYSAILALAFPIFHKIKYSNLKMFIFLGISAVVLAVAPYIIDWLSTNGIDIIRNFHESGVYIGVWPWIHTALMVLGLAIFCYIGKKFKLLKDNQDSVFLWCITFLIAIRLLSNFLQFPNAYRNYWYIMPLVIIFSINLFKRLCGFIPQNKRYLKYIIILIALGLATYYCIGVFNIDSSGVVPYSF